MHATGCLDIAVSNRMSEAGDPHPAAIKCHQHMGQKIAACRGEHGAGAQNRTVDLLITNQLLYP